MSMESEIIKLIKEYDSKIAAEEKVIWTIRGQNAEARRKKDRIRMEELRLERVVADARKQAYIQAKYDIDSLLDHLP